MNSVDGYLAEAERPWPGDVLAAVIAAIRESAPFDEALKWRQPFFSLNGKAVVKLFAAKEWINLFYYRGAGLSDPNGLLCEEGTSAMRRLRILRQQTPPLDDIRILTREAATLAAV